LNLLRVTVLNRVLILFTEKVKYIVGKRKVKWKIKKNKKKIIKNILKI